MFVFKLGGKVKYLKYRVKTILQRGEYCFKICPILGHDGATQLARSCGGPGDAKTMKATAACLPLHDASAQDAETISAKTMVGNKTMQSTTFYFTEFANLHRLCGELSLFSCLSVPIL